MPVLIIFYNPFVNSVSKIYQDMFIFVLKARIILTIG
jgi:hypothetical protein